MSLDYVKLKIRNPNINKILQSKKLNFKGNYSQSTGEIFETKLIAKIHYCKVEVFKSGSVYFTGSVHKLFNSLNGILAPNYTKSKKYTGYNGNQFTIENIETVKVYLTRLLYCSANQMVFKNIEIGLNLTVLFNPQKFLTGLLYHRGKQFEHSLNKSLWVAFKNDYRMKLYNKSKQYGMSNYTLRYELHFDRMARIINLGIATLEDVTKITLNKVHRLVLINEFSEIVYYDNTISKEKLTRRQLSDLTKYRDVRYWIEDLKSNKRDAPRKKLTEIIVNHSSNLKSQIIINITKTGVINTRYFNSNNSKIKKQTRVINTHSNINVFVTPITKRFCPITKVDISMQKANSNLLSNTGLRHLEKTNIEKFNFLVQKLITGNHNEFEENIYSKISKQIRNRYYNNSILHNLAQQRLFDKTVVKQS